MENKELVLKEEWNAMNEDFGKYRDRLIEQGEMSTAGKAGEILNILKSFEHEEIVALLSVMEAVDSEEMDVESFLDSEIQDDHI